MLWSFFYSWWVHQAFINKILLYVLYSKRLRYRSNPKWNLHVWFWILCFLNGLKTGQHSCPQFHLPPLGSLASRHLVAKVGTSKGGGKQWQTTPKNLPRMQRTRAIPVDWLSSGLCPNRPKGWIHIIIIIIMIRMQEYHAHHRKTKILSTKHQYMNPIFRKVTDLEIQPNNMKKEGGLIFGRSS